MNGTYRASLGAAHRNNRPLRVVLRLTTANLAALPREMLFDPETETPLTTPTIKSRAIGSGDRREIGDIGGRIRSDRAAAANRWLSHRQRTDVSPQPWHALASAYDRNGSVGSCKSVHKCSNLLYAGISTATAVVLGGDIEPMKRK